MRSKVLIVDDEPRNIRILEKIFNASVDLRSAATGEEALSAAESFHPDVILLDIMMPGIDGYETCQRFRANPKYAHTRVILVSGKAMVDERLKGYECGADDYVTKPFVPEELKAKVEVYLKLVNAERELSQLNAELEEKVRVRSEQLAKLEKAAFVGQYTAEIVHNLNTPLAVLKGSLELLETEVPSSRHLARASGSVDKMNEIIRSILLTGRNGADDTAREVDLVEILRSETKMLEALPGFRESVELHLDLQQLKPVKGKPTHFSQTFGNVLKNAIDAMYGRPSKVLSVKTRQDGENAVIEISDTGCGIDEKNLEKIFDPFYTSKPISAKEGEPIGTGLGLASVKRMLDSYHGSVQFDSVLEKGTTARLTFPTLQAIARSIPAPMAAPIPVDEQDRLEELLSYNVLDTPDEQIFDDLAKLASEICQTPVSGISLIDSSRHWFKAVVGSEEKELPREISFCAHTIGDRVPMVVEDAMTDDRFAGNPLVQGAPNIRFYAGAPLINAKWSRHRCCLRGGLFGAQA